MMVVVLVAVDACQLALWSLFQQCWDVTHASGRQTTMPLIYLVNNVVMGLKLLCVIFSFFFGNCQANHLHYVKLFLLT